MFSRTSQWRLQYKLNSLKTGTWVSRSTVVLCNTFVSSSTNKQPAAGSQYEQIPEYLKIHMFTPELEILRHDELRAPFKRFSSDFILKLLDQRANEVRLEAANSNPGSRLNNDNVVRFMKVSSRLKQLFNLNGGNTEVLDAVLHSQSALNAFEAKLAAKRQAKAKTQTEKAEQTALDQSTHVADLYAPGPYTQIPESLEIHDFADELALFRAHELKKNFGDVSAADLVKLLEKRLKEVYSDSSTVSDTQKDAQGICKHNLVRFYNLLPKLQKLLAWNGGTTSVLDTLLESQNVFKSVDEKIQSKRGKHEPLLTASTSPTVSEDNTYKPIPDDVFLEEYSEELKEVRKKLGSTFASASSADILKVVAELAESNAKWEKGLVFSKLYRNLAMLFKINDDQTFVLDNVLVNSAVFDKVESRLVTRASNAKRHPQKQEPSGQVTDQVEETQPQTQYRDSDHVIEMLSSLNSSEGSRGIREDFLKEEHTFKSALAQAMNKEEKSVFESDPKEYEEIVNLTSAKIRSNYRQSSEGVNHKQIQRDAIEKYLKKIKEKKHIAEENKWREQKAFEWSNTLYKNSRSFEAKNFFSPILGGKKGPEFPMFPGTGHEQEYVILSSNGQKFYSHTNPLGMNHVPEDMFAVLQTLSDPELAKFQKPIEKLRKKGWTIIGSGRTKGMLVLSRKARKSKSWRVIKFIPKALGLLSVVSVSGLLLIVSRDWVTGASSVDGINGEEEIEKKGTQKDSAKVSIWRGIFWK